MYLVRIPCRIRNLKDMTDIHKQLIKINKLNIMAGAFCRKNYIISCTKNRTIVITPTQRYLNVTGLSLISDTTKTFMMRSTP